MGLMSGRCHVSRGIHVTMMENVTTMYSLSTVAQDCFSHMFYKHQGNISTTWKSKSDFGRYLWFINIYNHQNIFTFLYNQTPQLSVRHTEFILLRFGLQLRILLVPLQWTLHIHLLNVPYFHHFWRLSLYNLHTLMFGWPSILLVDFWKCLL